MTFRAVWMAAAIGLSIVCGQQALAVPVSGTSGGSFSTLTGCDKSGGDRECGIVRSSNGNNTQVRWPYLDDHDQIGYASSLTSVDININVANSANDVVLARLDWFNAATNSDDTPDSLNVKWKLSIKFNKPNVSIDSEAFNLSIVNTDNPAGDTIGGFTVADLDNLSFSLKGWTIDDLRYSVVDGAGSCEGTDTYLTGSTWFNCENNMASLLITADFITAASSVVQEPATLALLAAGLLGLAVLRRRKA